MVAVSGGPDSLALVALTKTYSYFKKQNFIMFWLITTLEKTQIRKLKSSKTFKKKNINLKILINKKKLSKIFKQKQEV